MSVVDAKVSEGVAVGAALQWGCSGEACTLQTNSFFVTKTNAGVSAGNVTLFYNNNTWVGNGIEDFRGRFMVKDNLKLELTGGGVVSGQQIIVSAEITTSKITEVITMQANGIWINAYVELNSVSPLVFEALHAHGAGSHKREVFQSAIFGKLF